MKKDTIYIDNDDEITSITDKVQSAKSPIVALVLPKRCTVLQSSVNMKILNRGAQSAGKKVVLITSEAALLPVAGAAGLFVAKTLQSKPAVPAGFVADSDTGIENVSEDDEPIDTSKPIGELAGIGTAAAIASADESDEVPIEIGDEDTPDPKDAKKDKKGKKNGEKKNKKLAVPNFDSFRVKLFAAIGGLIALIALWYVMTNVLPKAVITVITEKNNVPVAMTFTASPTATQLDADKKIVPAQTKTIEKTETKKFQTTGEKDAGTKASGAVYFINCSKDDKLGDISRTVPAGTGISSGELTFITQEDVVVMPSGFSGNNCKSDKPSSEVKVVASDGGDKYNVSARSYSVAGFSAMIAKNTDGMSGGTTKIVKIVSQSDCDNAKNELLNASTEPYRKELTTQLQAAGLTPVTDTFIVTPGKTSCAPAVGAEASESTATVLFKASMMGVNTAGLEHLVKAEASKTIEGSQEILDTGVKTATLAVTSRESNGDMAIEYKSDAQTGIKQDANMIAQSVAGKKRGDTQSYIRELPGVSDVRVDYRPLWVSRTPKNVKHITVNFIDSDGNK